MTAAAAMMAALAAMTGLSQFHRAALGVVAPDLSADLALSPTVLGAANGMFFAALLVAQVPVGIALDRAGPRRTVGALTGIAVLGAVFQAFATDGTALLAARFLIGLGSAASFMAAVVLCARWYSGAAMTLALSRVGERLHLADQHRTGGMDRRREAARVAEGQHDDRRPG